MESSQRGRSPSAGHPSSARHTPAASPSPACRNLNSSAADTTTDLQSSTFASSNDFNLAASSASQQHSFNSAVDYNPAAQPLFPDQNFSSSGANLNQSDNSFPDFINFNPNQGLADSSFNNSLYTSSANDQSFGDATALDPALLDPQISPQSVPAANLFGQMATQNQQSPTPPHLLAPNMHRHSNSPHGSPAMGQGHFQNPSPNHSRHTSLDPSSAAYPQEQWGGGANFMGHRRTYSDAHSDVSSAQHSPYMPPADSFDHPGDHHSPNLGAQDPALFEGVMSMAHVSLSEASPSYISPAHSPHLSPALLPTQNHLPSFPQVDNYNLMHSMAPPMNHILPSSNVENFPEIRHDTPGQADAMSPPEISIQFAPPSRTTSFEPKENADGTGLTTPEKPRGRAKSDPFSSRGSAPARDLLSPAAAGVGSRSPSPSNKSRRSSTSSVPNRDYILDLADPSRPATNSNESGNSAKRTQKHPATFQCSLCPKRFTRAYNLRSHLRTHTDERPFVCSHCGKAFARQHDRKRHEGLHSGEKKFVCRGQLNDGNNWGCGRRFARADALGRHFRSEAGRVCIKPLMDEEARERDQPQAEPGSELGISIMPMPNQPMMAPQNGYGYGMPPHAGFQPGMHMQQQQMPVRLPAALLQQYPSLGGIWDNMAQNGPDEIEGEVSGRSSFDASSAGEYDEEDSYSYHQGGAMGWASDVGP